jgi:hypothetical protein
VEKLIKSVLDKYNTKRKKISNVELARLIVAHMKVGIEGKRGWYLNLNSLDGQHELAEEFIEEFGG